MNREIFKVCTEAAGASGALVENIEGPQLFSLLEFVDAIMAAEGEWPQADAIYAAGFAIKGFITAFNIVCSEQTGDESGAGFYIVVDEIASVLKTGILQEFRTKDSYDCRFGAFNGETPKDAIRVADRISEWYATRIIEVLGDRGKEDVMEEAFGGGLVEMLMDLAGVGFEGESELDNVDSTKISAFKELLPAEVAETLTEEGFFAEMDEFVESADIIREGSLETFIDTAWVSFIQVYLDGYQDTPEVDSFEKFLAIRYAFEGFVEEIWDRYC